MTESRTIKTETVEMSHYRLPEAVRSIVESRTGDAVFVVAPDYRVVYWDSEAEKLIGRLAGDTLGKRCFQIVLGERERGTPFCAYGCSVMHLARAGRPVSGYEILITTRSGEKRWVSISNLTVDTGEGPYLVHLMRDAREAHETLEMARALIQLSSRSSAPAPRREDIPELTPRQLEILNLLSEGISTRDICGALFLSHATVRNHVQALLRAFGAHSQLEMLAKARETGVLTR